MASLVVVANPLRVVASRSARGCLQVAGFLHACHEPDFGRGCGYEEHVSSLFDIGWNESHLAWSCVSGRAWH